MSKKIRTDDERVAEIDGHIKLLTDRMETAEDRSEISKLANSIAQMHHMRTAIEHLKLQRKKVEDEAKRKSGSDMSEAELDELVKAWLSARKK